MFHLTFVDAESTRSPINDMAYCLTIIVQRMINTFLSKKKRLLQIPGSTVRKTVAKGKGKVIHYNRMSFLCTSYGSEQNVLYTITFCMSGMLCIFSLCYYVSGHELLLFSCSVLSESLLMQCTRLPSLSQSPGACSNSCPSSQ